MKDILKLTDSSIPIAERYDAFLVWSNQHPSIIPDVISEQLGVDSSVVDVFHQLGELSDEFEIIDAKGIDIDALFILVRYDNPEVRAKVYESAEQILGDSQPMNALRTFLENLTVPNYEDIINQVSAAAWSEIAKSLKARNIIDGTITKSFRSMLVNASKAKAQNNRISTKMCDWIIRAMNLDIQNGHKIFSSENLIENFTVDFNLFESLKVYIEVLVS